MEPEESIELPDGRELNLDYQGQMSEVLGEYLATSDTEVKSDEFLYEIIDEDDKINPGSHTEIRYSINTEQRGEHFETIKSVDESSGPLWLEKYRLEQREEEPQRIDVWAVDGDYFVTWRREGDSNTIQVNSYSTNTDPIEKYWGKEIKDKKPLEDLKDLMD